MIDEKVKTSDGEERVTSKDVYKNKNLVILPKFLNEEIELNEHYRHRSISKFDAVEYLETKEDIKVFLTEVANTGDASDLIHAINTAARAKGMSAVADEAGVTRASLYKSLSEDGNPNFMTIDKVAKALGFRLTLVEI